MAVHPGRPTANRSQAEQRVAKRVVNSIKPMHNALSLPSNLPSHETATGRKEKHCWSFEIFWRAQPPKQCACHPRLFQPRLCSKELVRHQGANVLSLVSISNTLLAGVDIPLEIMCSLECYTGRYSWATDLHNC